MKGKCLPKENSGQFTSILKTYIEAPSKTPRVCTHKPFYSGNQVTIDNCKSNSDEQACDKNPRVCEFTAPFAVLHASSSCSNYGAAKLSEFFNIEHDGMCHDKCHENPQCKQFIYGRDGTDEAKKCYLLREVCIPVENPKYDTYISTRDPNE